MVDGPLLCPTRFGKVPLYSPCGYRPPSPPGRADRLLLPARIVVHPDAPPTFLRSKSVPSPASAASRQLVGSVLSRIARSGHDPPASSVVGSASRASCQV